MASDSKRFISPSLRMEG